MDVVSAFRVPSLADSLLFLDRDDRVSIAHAPFPSGTRPFSKPVVWDSTEDAPEARRTTLGGRRLVGVFFAEGFSVRSLHSPGARAVARVTMSAALARTCRVAFARATRAIHAPRAAEFAPSPRPRRFRGDSLGGGCRQHHRPFAASAGAAGPEALGMTKVLFVEVGIWRLAFANKKHKEVWRRGGDLRVDFASGVNDSLLLMLVARLVVSAQREHPLASLPVHN